MEWYILFLQKYGYLSILIGTLVEGDITLAMGSIFARQGLMNFWLLIVFAIVGSLTSQISFYFLGRWQGMAVVKRFPGLQVGYPKAHALVKRFGSFGILIVQYLYGMRLATSFVLGTLKLNIFSFIFWLLLAISIWAIVIATAGYTLGIAIHYLVSRMQILLTLIAAVIVALILAYRWVWRWTERQANPSAPEPVSQNSDTFYRRPISRKW
jgi:membrane protein DedA with SNARE-associated domain